MERIFEAPIEKLWKAHTQGDLMGQWWGPDNYEIVVEEYNATEGGSWKITHKGKDENGETVAYSFFGDFLTIKENDHITWTFNFEPLGPGHEITETVTFTDLGDGKTKLSTISHYKSLEDLEGMLQSGMEEGAEKTWNRLETLAKTN